MTLAEIMADTGHYSIDSTTVRAHVSAAGEKGGLIDALLAARGEGSPVNRKRCTQATAIHGMSWPTAFAG